MATPEEANHAAKKAVNGKLSEINDKVDELTPSDVDEIAGTDQDELQDFKDEIEEITDEIQEDVNAGKIASADRRMRGLRDKLRGKGAGKGRNKPKVKEEKRRPIEDLLRQARREKRGITAPPAG